MKVRVAVRINIERPPAEVFALVTDIAHQPEWSTAVEKVTDLTDQPPRVGTAWTQTTSVLGRRVEARARVVGLVQDRQFAYRIDRPAPVQMTWYLDPTSTGTHIEVVAEGEAGLFAPVIRPMLGPLKDALDADLERLKTRLESV
jgi:uncharacterized membrane protein